MPNKYLAIYDHLKSLCCIEKHYIPYKKMLLNLTPPMVPYLGVYLRDITFIEVGNSSYLDADMKVINYDKFRMLAAVLQDIRKYQQIPYPFDPLPELQTPLRVSMLTLDEDQLFNLSRIVEPSALQSTRKKSSSSFIRKIKSAAGNQ